MNDLLIKNVIHEKLVTDLLISGGRFKKIAPSIAEPASETLDFKGKMAVLPAFYNAHAHSAMTLYRGYADDLELFDWLQNYIWPAEAKLTRDQVYWGSRLAILEMIKSGTVFCHDMYWRQREFIRAAVDMKFRGTAGVMFIDNNVGDEKLDNDEILARRSTYPEKIQISLAPHAIYTVGEKNLRRVAEQSRADDMLIHIHVAETAREVADCLKERNVTPVKYLHSLGILGEKTVIAHSVHINDEDVQIIRDTDCVIAHCPVSNMKLVSGQLPYKQAVNSSCRIAIGTDGASSNNNLSMLDEMKFAALSAKIQSGDPTAGKAEDIFHAATRAGALAHGIDGGLIKEGCVADCQIVNLDAPFMNAGHNLIANMVYAADSSCIDTVVCGGDILMKHRKVSGEEEILDGFRKALAEIK